jgi:hypothetical protein
MKAFERDVGVNDDAIGIHRSVGGMILSLLAAHHSALISSAMRSASSSVKRLALNKLDHVLRPNTHWQFPCNPTGIRLDSPNELGRFGLRLKTGVSVSVGSVICIYETKLGVCSRGIFSECNRVG